LDELELELKTPPSLDRTSVVRPVVDVRSFFYLRRQMRGIE
jgi:hypothetical protein